MIGTIFADVIVCKYLAGKLSCLLIHICAMPDQGNKRS